MTRKRRHQIQQKSFKNLMFETNLMREESFLTDFHLICEDKEFLVHKVILSSASPYFKEHFKGNSRRTSLQIDFMNSKTLEIVLIYIYQGRIDLRNQSDPFLKDLVEAFIRLQIPLMYNYCLEHLLGTQQFLSQWNRIEQLNSDLIQQTYLEYLHKNIKTLKTTESFLNLTFEPLNAILKCHVSNPVNQEELISSILLWVKHDQSTRLNRITDLLTTIDFEKLNYSLLLKFEDEPLLEDNCFFQKRCRKLFSNELKKNRNPETIKSIVRKRVKNVTKFINSYKKEKAVQKKNSVREINSEMENKILPICQRKSKETAEEVQVLSCENKNQRHSFVSKRILVYDSENTKRLFEYNPNSETLTEMKDQILLNFFSSRAKYSAVCSFDNFIYTFGGTVNNCESRKCFMLNLLENKLLEIQPMNEPRRYPVAEKLHQFIYVIGCEYGVNSCERYNLITQSWEPMAKIPYECFSYRNSLLCIDGRLCLIGKTHLLWYNPQTEQWRQGDLLPNNLQREIYPSATYVNGSIFIVFYNSRAIYCLDLMMKTWNTFSPCDQPRNDLTSIICLKKSDRMEFLIRSFNQFFIFRPPDNWKRISKIPIYYPRTVSIGE